MADVTASGKVGRNDPCPCGSGIKYKSCCEGKSGIASNIVWVVLAVVMLIGVTIFIRSLVSSEAPGVQRIWSEEHGHYHTVP